MSLKALEVARECDKLYVEFYTLEMDTNTRELSRLVGKPVKELARRGLEEGLNKILKEAKENNVGVFVGGDALTATTHISILKEARERGIETGVIHGSSIVSAVGETGLQVYKFGRIVTLPKNETPESCYDSILQNSKIGLHSLVLLDIGMKPLEGLKALLKMERKFKKGLFLPSRKLIAGCCIGSEKQVIIYGRIDKLSKEKLGKGPVIIILPGELHFTEEEYLKNLK